jgi:hypothetical protein
MMNEYSNIPKSGRLDNLTDGSSIAYSLLSGLRQNKEGSAVNLMVPSELDERRQRTMEVHEWKTERTFTCENITSLKDMVITRDNEIIVCDTRRNELKVFNLDGQLIRTIGGPAQLNHPLYLAVSDMNEIFVVDNVKRIQVFNLSGDLIRTILSPKIRTISDITIYNNYLFVLDAVHIGIKHNITCFRLDGTYFYDINTNISYPSSKLIATPSGNLLLTIYNAILTYRFRGDIINQLRNGFDTISAVAITPQKNIVVLDRPLHNIQIFNEHYQHIKTINLPFDHPDDLAITPDGNICVSKNNIIHMFMD